MKNIIQFHISHSDGLLIAEGINVPVVTDARTFEELYANIREAVALYFEGEDPATLGFGKEPSILTNYELTTTA